jgi:hypothetical protein
VNKQETKVALLVGLEWIGYLIDRCTAYEHLFLKDAKTDASRILKESLLQLYAAILKYFAKAIVSSKGRYFHCSWLCRHRANSSLDNMMKAMGLVSGLDAHSGRHRHMQIIKGGMLTNTQGEFTKLQTLLDRLKTITSGFNLKLRNITHILEGRMT